MKKALSTITPPRRRNESGVVLATVLVLILTACFVVASLTNHSVRSIMLSRRTIAQQQAFTLAESGLGFGVMALRSHISTANSLRNLAPVCDRMFNTDAEFPFVPDPNAGFQYCRNKNGKHAPDVTAEFNPENLAQLLVTIRCGVVHPTTGVVVALKETIAVSGTSMSGYLAFFDGDLELDPFENRPGKDKIMHIKGPIHSNNDIYVGGNMRIYNDVTAAGGFYNLRKDLGTPGRLWSNGRFADWDSAVYVRKGTDATDPNIFNQTVNHVNGSFLDNFFSTYFGIDSKSKNEDWVNTWQQDLNWEKIGRGYASWLGRPHYILTDKGGYVDSNLDTAWTDQANAYYEGRVQTGVHGVTPQKVPIGSDDDNHMLIERPRGWTDWEGEEVAEPSSDDTENMKFANRASLVIHVLHDGTLVAKDSYGRDISDEFTEAVLSGKKSNVTGHYEFLSSQEIADGAVGTTFGATAPGTGASRNNPGHILAALLGLGNQGNGNGWGWGNLKDKDTGTTTVELDDTQEYQVGNIFYDLREQMVMSPVDIYVDQLLANKAIKQAIYSGENPGLIYITRDEPDPYAETSNEITKTGKTVKASFGDRLYKYELKEEVTKTVTEQVKVTTGSGKNKVTTYETRTKEVTETVTHTAYAKTSEECLAFENSGWKSKGNEWVGLTGKTYDEYKTVSVTNCLVPLMPCVRIRNASDLSSTGEKGLSITTDLGMYVEGNFNTDGVATWDNHYDRFGNNVIQNEGGLTITDDGDYQLKHNALLAADAVTVLSPNWTDGKLRPQWDKVRGKGWNHNFWWSLRHGQDWRDNWRHHMDSLFDYDIYMDWGERQAASMTVNSVIMTGLVPTSGDTYSGGVQNIFRLMEDWSRSSVYNNFNGSLICLWDSELMDAEFPDLYMTENDPHFQRLHDWDPWRWHRHHKVWTEPNRVWSYAIADPTGMPATFTADEVEWRRIGWNSKDHVYVD